jgi:hypothetical protein
MRPVRERKNAFGEIRLKDLSDDRRDSFFFCLAARNEYSEKMQNLPS